MTFLRTRDGFLNLAHLIRIVQTEPNHWVATTVAGTTVAFEAHEDDIVACFSRADLEVIAERLADISNELTAMIERFDEVTDGDLDDGQRRILVDRS